MKVVQNFNIMYILLVIAQLLICNYLHLSALVTVSILPVMTLCLPLSVKTIPALFIAFFTGLATDALADSTLGLNIVALVPVATTRFTVIRLIFGEDTINRNEDISIKKNGIVKISVAILIAQAVFFIIYIWADGAGTRPLWFNLARFAVSMAASYIIALITAHLLTSPSK